MTKSKGKIYRQALVNVVYHSLQHGRLVEEKITVRSSIVCSVYLKP